MRNLFGILSGIANHPLNRSQRLRALARFFSWQIGSRLVPGPIVVPFVDETRLLVSPGMLGATGNVYCGLHEFEDMCFVLHVLRSGDLFVDVGANVGSYTILAAGAAGANVIAVEPIPSVFAHLIDNVHLNNLQARVRAENIGLGSISGVLAFSTGFDTLNHVLTDSESSVSRVEVQMATLDSLLGDRAPCLLKIDVEGFETEVINGGKRTLSSPGLLGVIMELNGSGTRYGFDEQRLHEFMLETGFVPFLYRPFERTLIALGTKKASSVNMIYLRDREAVAERVRSAPSHRVHGLVL